MSRRTWSRLLLLLLLLSLLPATVSGAAGAEGLPALTDADRAAAFPVLRHPMVHGAQVHGLVLFDHFEVVRSEGSGSGHVDAGGWVGGDVYRGWFALDGEADAGQPFEGRVEAHLGRSITAWWDVVAGLRHDLGPGMDRTAISVGLRGLAPGFVETSALLDVDGRGRSRLRLQAEYNLLLTNRLILQPDIEVLLAGGRDGRRQLGSGLSRIEAGLRLRYEFTRALAPYVGVVHERAFGGTATRMRAAGEDARSTRWVAGIRFWF